MFSYTTVSLKLITTSFILISEETLLIIKNKVFEARNLPEARQRRKTAVKNSKAFHRAQKILLEVSSPNLMNFSDATDPYLI